MASLSFKARWPFRNDVRWKAAALGLEVQEFKGWIWSGFVISGDGPKVLEMWKWCEANDSGTPPVPSHPK